MGESRASMGDGEQLAGAVTQLIGEIERGDKAAQDDFCQLVYDELRAIARRAKRSTSGNSLGTTEIVNEFLGGLLANERIGVMKNRRYFYGAAADQMRRILIDRWRRNRSQARGGNRRQEELEPWLDELVDSVASRCGGDFESLELALSRLQRDRPRQHEIVQLKFFAGLTNEQIAEALEVSTDTVKRDWKIARARLGACLSAD